MNSPATLDAPSEMTSPNAAHGTNQRGPKSKAETDKVPLWWGLGQCAGIALVVMLSVAYNTSGWKSEGPEARPTAFDQLGFVVLGALVWLCTPNAGVIAAAAWKEAIRRRWMIVLLVMGVVVLGSMALFVPNYSGENEHFLRDFGTGFIIAITILMAIFLGVALVPPEIERRTIFTILAKPVSRVDFIIGKFLGLCLTLGLNLLILSLVLMLSYAVFKVRHEGWARAIEAVAISHPGLSFDLGNLASALLLHAGQLMVLASLALLISLLASPITSVVFCFMVYFGGQMSSYWEQLSNGSHTATANQIGISKGVQGVMNVIYLALPRLDKFDVRMKLVNDIPVSMGYIWKACDSGLIYTGVALVLACLIFSDREF